LHRIRTELEAEAITKGAAEFQPASGLTAADSDDVARPPFRNEAARGWMAGCSEVEVPFTGRTGEIFVKGKRIAGHVRGSGNHRHTTVRELKDEVTQRRCRCPDPGCFLPDAIEGPVGIALIIDVTCLRFSSR
jgi:hypothetical protein